MSSTGKDLTLSKSLFAVLWLNGYVIDYVYTQESLALFYGF